MTQGINTKKLLCIEEVSTLLNVPAPTIRYWCWTKRLPHYKLGKHLRVSQDDLEAFLKSSRREEGGNGHI